MLSLSCFAHCLVRLGVRGEGCEQTHLLSLLLLGVIRWGPCARGAWGGRLWGLLFGVSWARRNAAAMVERRIQNAPTALFGKNRKRPRVTKPCQGNCDQI